MCSSRVESKHKAVKNGNNQGDYHKLKMTRENIYYEFPPLTCVTPLQAKVTIATAEAPLTQKLIQLFSTEGL